MSLKWTTEEYINFFKEVHGNRYDYSLSVYIGSNKIIKIICRIHGVFEQIAVVHKRGHGCPRCSIDNSKSNLNDFIIKSNIIHNNKYFYSKTIYINSYTPVIITCAIHGDFNQTPHHHLQGAGCLKCSPVANKGTNLFIQMAMDVHGDRYDYTETVYKNRRTRVIIICRSHGRFKQFPQGHIRGNNCPRCVKTSISKIEMEWLDSININQQYRTQTIKFNNKWIIVDAYVPEINTVYEFYGDFWHGNPKKYSPEDINPINKKLYGDLYKITMDREELLKSAGYNLITIWESDYKNTK